MLHQQTFLYAEIECESQEKKHIVETHIRDAWLNALQLKALKHDIRCNCFLMSSLFQKFNQRGYRKYRHAQFHGVVHGSVRRSNVCSATIFLMVDLRSS